MNRHRLCVDRWRGILKTGTGPIRPPRTQNLVVEIAGYDPEKTEQGCYPGTIRGTIRGGRMNAKSVEVSIQETPTNTNTARVSDLGRETSHAYTRPGGYVWLGSAHFSGNRVRAGWATRLAGPEDEVRVGLPMQITVSRDAEGNARLYRTNSATVYNVSVLHTPRTETVSGVGDLFDAVSGFFEDNRAALITYTGRSGSHPRRTSHYYWRKWQDGAPLPVDEAVMFMLNESRHAELEAAIQTCGAIDVTPVEPLRIGPFTAASIDRGHRHYISLQNYRTGGLGRRIDTALRHLGQNEADAISQAFMAGLDPDRKAAFGRDGWKAMWNTDIARFFRGLQQEVPKVPLMGFAESVAVLKPFRTTRDGQQDYFLSRSRTVGPALPRDAVATRSDADAPKRYYTEFRELVSGAARILVHGQDPDITPREKMALQSQNPVYNPRIRTQQNTTDPIEPN